MLGAQGRAAGAGAHAPPRTAGRGKRRQQPARRAWPAKGGTQRSAAQRALPPACLRVLVERGLAHLHEPQRLVNVALRGWGWAQVQVLTWSGWAGQNERLLFLSAACCSQPGRRPGRAAPLPQAGATACLAGPKRTAVPGEPAPPHLLHRVCKPQPRQRLAHAQDGEQRARRGVAVRQVRRRLLAARGGFSKPLPPSFLAATTVRAQANVPRTDESVQALQPKTYGACLQ